MQAAFLNKVRIESTKLHIKYENIYFILVAKQIE